MTIKPHVNKLHGNPTQGKKLTWQSNRMKNFMNENWWHHNSASWESASSSTSGIFHWTLRPNSYISLMRARTVSMPSCDISWYFSYSCSAVRASSTESCVNDWIFSSITRRNLELLKKSQLSANKFKFKYLWIYCPQAHFFCFVINVLSCSYATLVWLEQAD